MKIGGVDAPPDMNIALCHRTGMELKPFSSAHWRERAAEARLVAESMRDPDAKRSNSSPGAPAKPESHPKAALTPAKFVKGPAALDHAGFNRSAAF